MFSGNIRLTLSCLVIQTNVITLATNLKNETCITND